ncbi:MAG: flagellar motor protein MotB [bacterium]
MYKKIVQSIFVIIMLLFMYHPVFAFQKASYLREEPPLSAKIFDLAIVRPLSIVFATGTTGIFIVTSPVLHMAGVSRSGARALVEAPWRFASARYLGDFYHYKDRQLLRVAAEDINALIAKLQLEKNKVASEMEKGKSYEAIINELRAEIERNKIIISDLKGQFVINMAEKILFDLGSAEINQGGILVLKRLTETLKKVKDKEIIVRGHTDNVPIKGELKKTYQTNWELSAARAISVVKFLESQGIDPTILSTAAYGEYRPIASNDTVEGRSENRRIEIILFPKERE